MGWVLCLLFLHFLTFLGPSHSLLCLPYESSSLLNFKNSFNLTDTYSFESWNMERDCCNWSGVTCDYITGHVVKLSLLDTGLKGVIDANNSLFSLTQLQYIDLAWNYFVGSTISPNFGRFSSLTHLDLSNSAFSGHIPQELAYLSKLLKLDLGSNRNLRADSNSLKQIVANLTSLTTLSLNSINMSDVLPSSFTNLSTSLIELNLGSTELKGQFPEIIFRLPNLEVLSLSNNLNLTGSFPSHNWTSSLKTLDLSETGLLVDFPKLIRSLEFLNSLNIINCSNIIPSFPTASSKNISELYVSLNNFGGKIPWASLSLDKLTRLDLSHNNFEGQLPYICSNSTENYTFLCDSSNHHLLGPLPMKLEYLELNNNFLNGTIPSWLYSLPNLRILSLSNNHFTGHFGEFQKASNVIDLDVSSNKLSGPIPRSLFQLKNLVWFDLSSNNFSGVVALEQFWELSNLFYLSFSFNPLLTVISVARANYTLPRTFTRLYLSSCNVSEFPSSLKDSNQLQNLDLSNNKIEGNVPKWLWNVGWGSLNLSYNSLTHLDPLPLESFKYIDLKSNHFQGHLPILPRSTVAFFASDNQFSEGISSLILNQSLLEIIDLANNRLEGELSSLICNQSSLVVLNLSNNSLIGDILPCLGSFSNSLSVLDLKMNKLNGIVPSAFSKGSSLTTLNLNGNRLEGLLPRSLLNSQKLQVLDVGNNKLNGSFPQFLESLPDLRVLVLRSNRFHGGIADPKIMFPFRSLRIMDLSDNAISGALPAKYFENFKAMIGARTDKLEYLKSGDSYYQDSVMVTMKGVKIELVRIQTMFITIDLSRNRFAGEIPKSITKLDSLKGLNLSRNKLTGSIPSSLGSLTNLEWLDLSSNKLEGKIPPQLASNLNQLSFLNLSYNKFEGHIPRGSQFDTFDNNSYGGNLGLCGIPLTKLCSNDKNNQEVNGNEKNGSRTLSWKIMTAMGYGAGLVIGASLGFMGFFSRRFDCWLNKKIIGLRRPRQRHCRSLAEIIKQRK